MPYVQNGNPNLKSFSALAIFLHWPRLQCNSEALTWPLTMTIGCCYKRSWIRYRPLPLPSCTNLTFLSIKDGLTVFSVICGQMCKSCVKICQGVFICKLNILYVSHDYLCVAHNWQCVSRWSTIFVNLSQYWWYVYYSWTMYDSK